MENQEKQRQLLELEALNETLQNKYKKYVHILRANGVDVPSLEAARRKVAQSFQEAMPELQKMEGLEFIAAKEEVIKSTKESIKQIDSQLRQVGRSGCALFLIFLISPMLAAGVYGLYTFLP